MTAASDQKLDPLAILREELIAAALCHGVERCEELAESTVKRYVDRVGGTNSYVPARAAKRDAARAEIVRLANGRNTKELAKKYGYTVRRVQQFIADAQKEKGGEIF